MMWIGGLFILLSLAWVIARTSGYGLEAPISYRPPASPSHRPRVPSANPPPGENRLFGTNVEAIPSLVSEEDDLELTIITASPSADMHAYSLSTNPTSAEQIRAETPSVKVIYEDEAEI